MCSGSIIAEAVVLLFNPGLRRGEEEKSRGAAGGGAYIPGTVQSLSGLAEEFPYAADFPPFKVMGAEVRGALGPAFRSVIAAISLVASSRKECKIRRTAAPVFLAGSNFACHIALSTQRMRHLRDGHANVMRS